MRKTLLTDLLLVVSISLAVLIPAVAHADWNQANDEANRQRMMAEMRANAAAADRANEQSQRRQQQDFENRSRSSGGSSSSGSGSSGGSGGYTPYGYHATGPASVVETYSFKIYRQETEAQTFARISKEAAAGQAQSQFNLARIYYAGYGANARDDVQARKWFGAAANQGHIPAEAQYGAMLYNGRGGPADPASGLEHLKHAADKGEHYAEALYGFYTLSAAAKVDPDRPQPAGVALLERAADAGEVVAQNALGRVVYLLGVGAPHDRVKAIKYLKLAAAQNDPSSMYDLGQHYAGGSGVETDPPKGIDLIRRSADMGYGDAEAFYGFYGLVQGRFGVAKNDKAGADLLRRADQYGSADGTYYLALLTVEGRGVPRDPPAALALLKRSADRGSADGQARYGMALIQGDGFPKDITQGAELIRLSAEGQSDLGQEYLARLYYDGLGVPKDRRLAAQWMAKAAKQGNPGAIQALKTDPELAALTPP
jgi:TPR repeat protein